MVRVLRPLLVTLMVVTPALGEEAEVARGRQVYEQNRCRLCHSVEGKGNKKGPHDGVGSRLDAAALRDWIRKPEEMARKAGAKRFPPMPSFASLPEADVDALVAYLQTLKKK